MNKPYPETTDVMTLDELRARMDISATVAYELAKRDALPVPTLRIGRQYRFSRKAYEALLARQHAEENTSAA